MAGTRMILQTACQYGAAEAGQRQGVSVIAGKGLWVKYTGSEASNSSSFLSVFLGCFSLFPLLYLVSHPFFDPSEQSLETLQFNILFVTYTRSFIEIHS